MVSTSSLRDAVAYVYRREGGGALSPEELAHRVSFDLRWLSPGEARAFVEQVRDRDLVADEDGELVPTFDVDEPDLPVSYEPDLDLEPRAEAGGGTLPVEDGDGGRDLVSRVAEDLAEETEWTAAEAQRAVARERERLGDLVTDEAAALLVARRKGLDVGPWLEAAREAAAAGDDA